MGDKAGRDKMMDEYKGKFDKKKKGMKEGRKKKPDAGKKGGACDKDGKCGDGMCCGEAKKAGESTGRKVCQPKDNNSYTKISIETGEEFSINFTCVAGAKNMVGAA